MAALRFAQRGTVAVLVTVGMLAIVAMVGLALDTGHLVANKSRLQSSVDAAALAAAKVLDLTGSAAQATAAARVNFDANAAAHPELDAVLSGSDLLVSYSNTLSPFVPGSNPPLYARVVARNFTMWTSFTKLVGAPDAATGASAVAGPSAPLGGQVCDVAPVMVCGDPAAGEANNWGYSGDNVTILKLASGTGPIVGPGNFQLIELGQSGANELRQNMAGSDYGCVNTDGTVTTKPGNNVGPTAQGLNTRFNDYQGAGLNSTNYPPDLITNAPRITDLWTLDGTEAYLGPAPMNPMSPGIEPGSINDVGYTHDQYRADTANGPHDNANGKPRRRVVAVPITDCSTVVNGHGTVDVLGYGCFFLLQPTEQNGTDNYIYGQYIGQCGASGSPGPNPGPVGGPGVYKIVLHNDPVSGDS